MLLGIVYVLLALAILIALLGIADTMSPRRPRVPEGDRHSPGRRPDPAPGAGRRAARVGDRVAAGHRLGLGGFLGWALSTTVSDSPDFTVPITQLVVVTVVGVVAGALVARRPARLPILDAIGST